MNKDNIDIEEMRKAWYEMGRALGIQTLPDSHSQDLARRKTALDRLRDRYLSFWVISLVMTVLGFLIFSRGVFVTNPLNFWLGVAYAGYFLIVSSMDFWLWKGLGQIDPLRLSVTETSAKSLFYRKRHLQFMAVLIPMAATLLCFTGYVFSSEMFFINGMIAGAIIGLIIGTVQLRRFMSGYRKLTD